MKKIISVILVFCGLLPCRAQVVVNLQLPAMGLMIKSQLWNLSIVNTGTADIEAQVEVLLTDASNNQQVLSGTTRTITLPKGAKQLTSNDVLPVSYNVLNPGYNLDASQDGFLPIGLYHVCYTVIQVTHGGTERLSEECEDIQVDPISPPMLISPADSDRVDMTRPLFTWVPPSPFILFNNLSYQYTLVEVMPLQTASDAIQQNIPLQTQQNIYTNSMQYPLSSPELDTGKLYAWQVAAVTGGNIVSKSEVWSFRIRKDGQDTSHTVSMDHYARPGRTQDASYTLCNGILRFVYLNEYNDATIPFKIYDITNAAQREVGMDSTVMDIRYGENYKQFDFTQGDQLTDKHIYLLELVNSRNESWYLKFEYRKPD